MAIGSLNMKFRIFDRSWLNWRLGETLRWKVKTVGWKDGGVVCRKLAPSRL
jgi:hypothetical protein